MCIGGWNSLPFFAFPFFPTRPLFSSLKTGNPPRGGAQLCPIGDGAHRFDPDRGALKPPRTIKLIIGIPRRMAFRAFRYLLDEIASPAGLTIGSAGRSVLRAAHDNGRPRAEKKQERENREDNH